VNKEVNNWQVLGMEPEEKPSRLEMTELEWHHGGAVIS